MRTLHLEKASNGLICNCRCDSARIAYPGQLNCPWRGCGWLFSCIECRTAFTFATAVFRDESYESVVHRDLAGFFKEEPSPDFVAEVAESLEGLYADLIEGVKYVCLDGRFIPIFEEVVQFDGWYASHDLDFVPQVLALVDPTVVDTILQNPDYWFSNKHPSPTYH